MPITTYDELKTSIADFLNRDDLTSIIPDFITMAEAQMRRDVRHWRMERRSTANVDSQYTALPQDFIEPIRVILLDDNTSTMELVGTFEISQLREAGANRQGKPQFYTILDGSFEVFPTPDGTYSMELVYYADLPDLATNSTNWLLTNYPDAYLYSSLAHSAPYLQEDMRLQTWSALYQAAISAINLESERAKSSGAGRRIKIRSY
jgi:hypothetical protein